MRMHLVALGLLLGGVAAAHADPARPVVVELFTSEGCSSCPPADALLGELARDRKDVLPLAFHVTYWNGLGWRDPYSLEAATTRQTGYRGISQLGTIYTPQMVIEGTHDVVGSDRPAVRRELQAAIAGAKNAAMVTLRRQANGLSVSIAAGTGSGTVWLVGYDPQHVTSVARGENAGRTLTEANVVRSITPVGTWNGAAAVFTSALPEGMASAVIVQSANGGILGAGVTPAG